MAIVIALLAPFFLWEVTGIANSLRVIAKSLEKAVKNNGKL